MVNDTSLDKVYMPRELVEAMLTLAKGMVDRIETYQDADVLLRNPNTKLYALYCSSKSMQMAIEKALDSGSLTN